MCKGVDNMKTEYCKVCDNNNFKIIYIPNAWDGSGNGGEELKLKVCLVCKNVTFVSIGGRYY